MIVKNRNVYNYSDCRHPVLFSSTDYRTSTHRGHSLYPSHGQKDVISDHQPANFSVSGWGRNHACDYGTQYNRFHDWKYPERYEDIRFNLPMRLTRVNFGKGFGEKIQLRPVSSIDEYQTIQRQDFTERPLTDWRSCEERVHIRRPLKPIFQGYSNDSSYHKFVDPYQSTQGLDYSLFTAPEEISISQKDNITVWDWLKYPKTNKGYGLKEFPDVKLSKMPDSLDRIPLAYKIPIRNRFPETGSSFKTPLKEYSVKNVYSFGEIAASAPREKLSIPKNTEYGSTRRNINVVGLRKIPRQRR